jgi:hypothetical protein
VDSISDRKDGAKKIGRQGEMDRKQNPEEQSQQKERSAREAKDSGNSQTGQHLSAV